VTAPAYHEDKRQQGTNNNKLEIARINPSLRIDDIPVKPDGKRDESRRCNLCKYVKTEL